jgi:hypothetical protein
VRAVLSSVLQSVGEEKKFLQQAAAAGREACERERRGVLETRADCRSSRRPGLCLAVRSLRLRAPPRAEPRVVYTGHQQHAPPLAMRDVAVLVAEERVEYRHPRLIPPEASGYARMYMPTHAAVLMLRPQMLLCALSKLLSVLGALGSHSMRRIFLITKHDGEDDWTMASTYGLLKSAVRFSSSPHRPRPAPAPKDRPSYALYLSL